MIRLAFAFFALAIISFVLGATEVAGISTEIGRTWLTIFVILAVVSYLGSVLPGQKGG